MQDIAQNIGGRAFGNADDPYDIYVNRPLASILVKRLVHTSVTPNQITTIAASLGLGAAFMVATGHLVVLPYAALFLGLYMVLDCADGQLARLTGGSGWVGRLWDGTADWLVAVALHLGIWAHWKVNGLTLFGHEFSDGGAFAVILLAGASMGFHSMGYDSMKSRLKILAGHPRSTHTPDEVSELIEQSSSRIQRLALRLYRVYCASQARMNQNGEDKLPAHERRRRAEILDADVAWWAPAGPTVHLLMIAISFLATTFFSWGPLIYVVWVTTFVNVWTAFVMLRSRRRLASVGTSA
ncbi:MAG: CDP-alcohol phosphatidyltransferase family protein [Myxococcales bacterium]|nr:CDP-alcohol phosphatidyltransferase family protein [Myxococcales bacterium]